MNSYKVQFPVQTKARLRLKGKLTSDIELEESAEISDSKYAFIVKVDANDENSAYKQASDIASTYLNTVYLILNEPAKIDQDKGALFYEQVQDEWKLKGAVTPFKINVQASPLNQRQFLQVIEKAASVASRSSNQYLRIALDFCARSVWEEYNENKFIDLFIAFEALFSDGQRTELTYKLANRVATLLGAYNKGRKDIADRMRILYNKRSELMHGDSKVKIENADIQDALQYLKLSLTRFISLASKLNREQIIQLLNDALLDSEKHAELERIAKE